MKPAPTPRPDAVPDPEIEGLLVDRARGEIDATGLARLAAWARAEGRDLQAESGRTTRLLDRLREAHAARPDPEVARRLSAFVRAEVGREEAREARGAREAASRRRLVWARVIALSALAHLVVLALVVFAITKRPVGTSSGRVVAWAPPPVEGLGPAADEPLGEPVGSPWLPQPGEGFPEPLAPKPAPTGPAERSPESLSPLEEHQYDHPRGVVGPMLDRIETARKRVRLEGLGLDADHTLETVHRGLAALRLRQRPGGAFAGAGDRTDLGETALALLPFLGDGNGSRTGADQAVVATGVAWIRARLAAGEGELAKAPAFELGIALKALSEDYMLSYGRLTPHEASTRATEIAALTGRVVGSQRDDGSFAGAENDLRRAIWPMWGLEAAARTGAVLPPASVAERFAAWFERTDRATPMDDAASLLLTRQLGERVRAAVRSRAARVAETGVSIDAEPFVLATTGAGLVREAPAAFRAWSRDLDRRLARRLTSVGVVRDGDPVGDTALVLLALQAAYRTY